MARLLLRFVLYLTCAMATIKADELVQLLDEILQAAPASQANYDTYSEPVAMYGQQSGQYSNSQQASVDQTESTANYDINGKAVVDNGYGKEGYDYMSAPSYGYGQHEMTSYQAPQPSYGYGQQPSYGYGQKPSYGYEQQPSYGYEQQPSYGYEQQPSYGYMHSPSYGYSHEKTNSGYGQEHHGYGYKPKVKKVYVPIVVKKKKKKMKIISVEKGFYVPGGTQLFGKYKSLKACEKACAATPNCFAGDYNPWFKKCYIHSNYTACGTLSAHKKLIHFKKVPCTFLEAPNGRVMLGVQIFMGVEQKKVKSLSDCLKCCAALGKGVPATSNDIQNQICYGIDYDFATHKCYFHVDNNYPKYHFCPLNGSPPKVPRDTVPNPSVISILLCPGPFVG